MRSGPVRAGHLCCGARHVSHGPAGDITQRYSEEYSRLVGLAPDLNAKLGHAVPADSQDIAERRPRHPVSRKL